MVAFDSGSSRWLLTRKCPGDTSWTNPIELTTLHPTCDRAPRMAVSGDGRIYLLVDDGGCTGCSDYALEVIHSDDCGQTWQPYSQLLVTCYTPTADDGPTSFLYG